MKNTGLEPLYLKWRHEPFFKAAPLLHFRFHFRWTVKVRSFLTVVVLHSFRYLWLCSYPSVFSQCHPWEQVCFPALVALVRFHVERCITSVKGASSLQTTVSRCFCMLFFVLGEPQTSSHFYGHAPENHIWDDMDFCCHAIVIFHEY